MLTVACCALHGGLALVPALPLQPVTFLSVAIYRVLFCMPHFARTSNQQVCYTYACSGVALDRFSGPRPARTNVGSKPLKHAGGNALPVRWCSVHRDLPSRHAHQHGARWRLDRRKCGDSRVSFDWEDHCARCATSKSPRRKHGRRAPSRSSLRLCAGRGWEAGKW